MYYGWVIVFIAMVAVAATSPGQSYLLGKLNASIELELGIKATTLTAAYGAATVLAAVPLPLVGWLADRHGPRIVMGLSALTLGIGCVLIGCARGPFTLAGCYFLLRFAGQGALGLSASHSTAMWFEKRLGTVTGIKFFAMPAAIFILAPATTWLIREVGWKQTYALLGMGVWVAILPLVLLAHRNRPDDLGERVDGERPDPIGMPVRHPHAHADAELIAGAAPVPTQQVIDLLDDPCDQPGEVCFTHTEAMKTLAFWLIAAAMAVNALIGTAFVFLLGRLTATVGLPPTAADQLLSIFAIGSAVFAPLAGILTDRLQPRWLVSAGTTMLLLACVSFAVASGLLVAQVGMLWLAASQTLIFVSGGTLLARFFGRPHHGAIRASLAFAMVLGTALGPFLAAWSAERISYTGTLWLFAAITLPIALAGLAVRPPRLRAPGASPSPIR